MSITQLLEALENISTTNSVEKLREMRTAIELEAHDQLYHLELDTQICGTEGFEDYYAFNKVLWTLSEAIDLRIKSREKLWVGVEGIATV